MIENQTTEFKREYTDDIKKTTVAFLNTDGGVVYVGVDDSGNIVGLENPDDVMTRLSSSTRDSIRPDCTCFFKIDTEILSGKTIVKMNVTPGTRKPYYLGDKGLCVSGVFVRRGSASVPADEETIRAMIKESDNDSFEEAVCARQNLTFETAAKYFSAAGIDFSKNKQKTLGFFDDNDFFTNLAQLFSDQCEHTVKCAIFEGTTRDVFKDRQEFSGSLFAQIDNVLSYLNVYNKTFSKILGKERTDIRDYPESVLREALLNAVVHRDYSYGGSILVSLYDDRLEIMSPGGFVKNFDEQLLKEGISVCRNKKLADIFYRFKYIEAYGTGIPRIFENYKTVSVQPKLINFKGAVKIILPNINAAREPVSTMEIYKVKILKFLENRQYITKEEAAEVTGVKPARAYVVLEELAKTGVLKIGKISRRKIYFK